ncbi:hypothetical protein O181_004502 [Austropuccinia psidii MF-1]|uniref:Mediator of RNA polymerase II transcription subunit 10 n=1 Tax=Austropuccinia psidii MF-1 TaxID=1389203 RepID=A0A9Q3GFV1_9BASI|nr:hypothetical protein [Austropuccinia psidii MF-1]
MSPSTASPATVPHSTPGFQSDYANAEDSQRSQLEDKLEQLLQSLLEVGICTSDVQENAREGGKTRRGEQLGPGGLIGKKINESIAHMAELYELNATITSEIPIPIEVINQVDQGTNPDRWLKSFIERAAHENMYTNGILSNLNQYSSLLQTQLADHFPELSQQLNLLSQTPTVNHTTTHNDANPNPCQ